MSFLYDHHGKRKYLTVEERRAFLRAANRSLPQIETFCLTLAFTGARISEVLALTPDRIDYSQFLIVIESLKKRKAGMYRGVPVPASTVEKLDAVHDIRTRQQATGETQARIWPWCRTAAWMHVKDVMAIAGIHGPHASPKGLRHAFGVSAIQSGLPINLVQRWMGHSRLTTTVIYADAVGEEERAIAGRLWKTFEQIPLQ